MTNSAFTHEPTITVPSTTQTGALVRWGDTSGGSFTAFANSTTGISSDGTHLTMLRQGLVKFEGASAVSVNLGVSGTVASSGYNIYLPLAAPGGNDKMLQSNNSGQLVWIDTPAGGDFSNGGDNGALVLGTNDANSLTLETNNTARMVIAAGGEITLPTQPAFQVYLSSDSEPNQNGDVDIVPFNSTSGGRDQGGYFNTTGSNETIRGITVLPYQFLAPVAGFYLLTCFIAIAGQGSGADRVEVRFDVVPNGGSQVSYNCRVTTASLTTELRVPFSMVVYVVADAQIRCMAGTYGAANQQGTRKEGSWFSGILLG